MNYNPQKKPPRMGNLVDQQGTIEKEASPQADSFLVDLSEPAATTMQPPVDTKPKAKRTAQDTEKLAIYLPKSMALSLRMVFTLTKRKFSHVCEAALDDMLYHRYQCNSCHAKFSISESDTVPSSCPCCGSKDIGTLYIDRL